MEYKTGIDFRKEKLKQLLHSLVKHEKQIISALYSDFKKPEFEVIATETGYVISDLKRTIKNIHNWSKPQRVFPSLLNFPSTDYILREPYGKVLIISPWNYPYQLALCPLIAAVAAGNQVVLKPSELTPNTSSLLSIILSEVFEKSHVEVIEGGSDTAQQLLRQRWDFIFFTGSVSVGKIVAKAAAEFMTPVTLELGGKNPCIVADDSDLKLAAKRIVWGKFINAGQTCIAPDYLIVHRNCKSKLIDFLIKEISSAYGENPDKSADYPRIINSKNWHRLTEMMQMETILFGGEVNEKDNYIAPTLLNEPRLDSTIMSGEIFGPILPILSYEDESEIEAIITRYEKPLSLYVFSKNHKWSRKIMNHYSFGGGCINDTVIHFSNHRLPFGGVGNSGMGAYHGKLSFDTFSHKKSVVKKANWLDVPIRYAPYKNKIKLLKKILNWF